VKLAVEMCCQRLWLDRRRWARSDKSRQSPTKWSKRGEENLFMRAMIVLTVSFGMTVAIVPAQAQDSGGNAASGRALAEAWCAECHRVERTAPGASVADFTEVANLPSTTALSLKVFLQSSHKDMPNLILKPAEADDIIAYILSLKSK
jgi:mono/diheme cytochrome c family protein